MQNIGEILSGKRPATRRACRRYRKGARFIADPKAWSKPIDRNARSKILYLAEALERRTKRPGCPNGCLGWIGVKVLRALILHFHNKHSGLTCPSYTALQAMTGVCRSSIASAIQRLEKAGILQVMRRLVRERVTRVSPHTGEMEIIVTTVQTSNLYRFICVDIEEIIELWNRVGLPVGKQSISILKKVFREINFKSGAYNHIIHSSFNA